MSALNVCHKPDRAIIMQDAACYDRAGVVTDFVEKGREIPGMGCFVACTGAALAAELMARLLPQSFSDIDAVAAGEADLDFLYRNTADALARWGSRGLAMVVAGWSAQHDRPRIVFFSRGIMGDLFGPDVGRLVHPHLEGAARRAWQKQHGMDSINIERFEPLTDGIALLELQRSQHLDRGAGKARAHLVGGFVTLTEVRRDGTTTRVVHEWDEDRIGAPIEPAALVRRAVGARVGR